MEMYQYNLYETMVSTGTPDKDGKQRNNLGIIFLIFA